MYAIGRLIGGHSSLARARRSRIHGTGLFAKKDIPEGEKIIEYTGEKITKAEGNRRYDDQAEKNQIYLFELNSRYDIDGSAKGNIAKYANHSCDPNAEAIVEKGEIWLVALTDIGKGEEITFDYNFPLFDHEKRPCRCGSDNCRGWIINKDSYYYLKRKKQKRGKKAGAKRGRKSGAKKAGAKRAQAGDHAVRKTPTRTDDSASGAPRKVKKAGKKAAKRSAKKTGKKTTRKPGNSAKKGKSAKKARKKATRKPGKSTKKGKTAKKAGKKATKKAGKNTTRKPGKSAKKGKTAKKAGKRSARKSSR